MFHKVIELFKSVLAYYLGLFPPILALVVLSVSMFILFVPLYKISDGLVERDKKRRSPMQDDLDKIKKLNNSVERYHYTREIYRIHNYHPIQSMVGLFGLALQVPLFLIAYFGLHSYEGFEGMSTWVFSNLGKADGLLNIVPEIPRINILPFVMTGVSILSGWIYSLGDKKRDWVQILFFPMVFLVLLYREPTALVIYWTINNVLSLIKNTILAKKKKVKILTQMINFNKIEKFLDHKFVCRLTIVLWCVGSILLLLYFPILIHSKPNGILFSRIVLLFLISCLLILIIIETLRVVLRWVRKRINLQKVFIYLSLNIFLSMIISILLIYYLQSLRFGTVLQIYKPILMIMIELYIIVLIIHSDARKKYLSYFRKNNLKKYLHFLKHVGISNSKPKAMVYNIVLIFSIMLMLGIATPLLIYSSDPLFFAERINFSVFYFQQAILTLVLSFIAFLLSFSVLRGYITITLSTILFYFFINSYLAPGSYGQMEFLMFQNDLSISYLRKVFSVVLLIILFIFVTYSLGKRKLKLINFIIVAITMINIIVIFEKSYLLHFKLSFLNDNKVKNITYSEENSSSEISNEKIFLSRDKKNIIIIMLDRFIGSYMPFILNEGESLQEKLDGFVYFPNSISQSSFTYGGFPAILGGYEYALGSIKQEISEGIHKNLDDRYVEAYTLIPQALEEKYQSTFVDVIPSLTNKGLVKLENAVQEIKINRITTKNFQKKSTQEVSSYTKELEYMQAVLDDLNFQWERFIFVISIFRTAGDLFREIIYKDGTWMGMISNRSITSFLGMLNNYNALNTITDIFEVSSEEKSQYVLIHNNFTHDIFDNKIFLDNFGNGISEETKSIFQISNNEKEEYSYVHFLADLNAIKVLTSLFDRMKELNVYDNTKIYIVSDHGRNVLNPLLRGTNVDELDKMWFSSLLMSKDYSSRGKIQTDNTFTTNADVAYEILKGENIIKNPYTGKMIKRNIPNPLPLYYTEWNPEKNEELVNNDFDIFVYSEYELYNQDIYNDDNWSAKE